MSYGSSFFFLYQKFAKITFSLMRGGRYDMLEFVLGVLLIAALLKYLKKDDKR